VADAVTQERIVAAHHAAVADVIDFFEREVAATRAGISDRDGAVAQVDVAGVAAVAYDHFDSRAGDPQLHTHVVIANKVLTVMDGRWRSLDGRPVFASRTGLSAHYDALVADRLSRDLGIEWELRQRGPDRNARWEIAGVSDDLITEFSSRTREIELKKDELIAEYAARHGRTPSAKTIVELRAQATLATRPPKEVRSLADLTADWRQRAAERLGTEPSTWSRDVIGHGGNPLTADDVPLAAIEAISADVVAAVSVKRAVWTHWNLMAEASKQTMDLRFATTEDREAVIGLVVDAAQSRSVVLTPPELALSPARFQREDGGTTRFRPRHGEKYSSTAVLDAEARLLSRAEKVTAPTVVASVAVRAAASGRVQLSAQQRRAVESICSSGRQVDVLVGPAGAGKTTTMRALRAAWTAEHGRGSVVGLAPSAAASQALADDLGVACENTAKWLHEYDQGRTELRRGQLMIVDEATLADTKTLDRLTGIAAGARAKVLLVGDPHQLQSVDAGGAFALLVNRRADAPKLVDIHRFTNEWEKDASLALSRGDVQAISAYGRHKRIREGVTDEMVNAAYVAWRADCAAGRASILVTESARDVRALNERARAERLLLEGAVDQHEVDLGDGCRASFGDVVITRQNDRRIRTMRRGWVKNGDRWRVTDIRPDGAVVVKRLGAGGGRTVLPAEYVAEHLDLGYAVTAHRAQGVTVDTAHVVVTPSTTRENLYVSMTRGRDSNIVYVALDQPDDSHSTPEADDLTARTVLYGVLQHSGADLSATQMIEVEYEVHGGIDRLAAELETIAAEAQHDRFAYLLSRSGLTFEQHAAVVESTSFGPLVAALRRAEAYHHDLECLVPRVVGRHGLDDAEDIAAVLRYRVDKLAATPPRGCHLRPRMIAGLIPEPLGAMSPGDRQAIDERKELIEERARALAERAVARHEAWTRRLRPRASDAGDDEARLAAATTVAAYRDRYKITSDLPVGGGAKNDAQRWERQRALAALRVAGSADSSERLAPSPSMKPRAISAP
jgi:conjugative relaxase-like TrwC/TraI family protein